MDLHLSAMEVWEDDVYDLLPAEHASGGRRWGNKLKVTVPADKGWGVGDVSVEGLTEHSVVSAADGLALLARALGARGRADWHGPDGRRQTKFACGHVLVRMALRVTDTRPGRDVLSGRVTFADLAAIDDQRCGEQRALSVLREVFLAIAAKKSAKCHPARPWANAHANKESVLF